jgi:ankyrin repeat protein
LAEQAADPFFDAIKSGDVSRVKALVVADPSLVDATTGTGQSAVLTAVYHRHKEIADLLVARGASLTLCDACAAGEVERVERLLGTTGMTGDKDDALVNQYNADGWTPLHLAAFFGHMKVAELLLAHGADVAARSRNANGNTPLHAALAANQKMLAGLLLGHGADLDAADAAGWRPLHLATAHNNVESMKALIAQGANVALGQADGTTPLAMAIDKGHREAEALLRRHGA